jgi:hypothetical protein
MLRCFVNDNLKWICKEAAVREIELMLYKDVSSIPAICLNQQKKTQKPCSE